MVGLSTGREVDFRDRGADAVVLAADHLEFVAAYLQQETGCDRYAGDCRDRSLPGGDHAWRESAASAGARVAHHWDLSRRFCGSIWHRGIRPETANVSAWRKGFLDNLVCDYECLADGFETAR